MCVSMCAPSIMCRGQRTTFKSWSSPCTICVLGWNLGCQLGNRWACYLWVCVAKMWPLYDVLRDGMYHSSWRVCVLIWLGARRCPEWFLPMGSSLRSVQKMPRKVDSNDQWGFVSIQENRDLLPTFLASTSLDNTMRTHLWALRAVIVDVQDEDLHGDRSLELAIWRCDSE